MLQADPAGDEGMDPDDLYSAENEDEVFATDQTGTVAGIARGFGTHLAPGHRAWRLPGGNHP